MGTGSTSSDRKAARSAGAADSGAGGASESGNGSGSGPGGAVDPANGGIIRAVSIHFPVMVYDFACGPPFYFTRVLPRLALTPVAATS